MDESGLVALFAEEFDAKDVPAGQQLQLLTTIDSLYEAKGILRDKVAPPCGIAAPTR